MEVTAWMQDFREKYADAGQPYFLSLADWRYLGECDTFDRINDARMMFAFRKYINPDNTARLVKAFYSGGYNLSRNAVDLEASNPKDFVYGLMGVSGFAEQPEYDDKIKTVVQVYEQYTTNWLTSIVRDLGDDRFDDLCDLWFMEIAGRGFHWPTEKVPNLPSWVPNFVGIAEEKALGRKNRFRADAGKADDGVFRTDCILPETFNSTLRCSSVMVGQVTEVGMEMSHDTQLDNRDEEADEWQLSLFDLAANSMMDGRNNAYKTLLGMARALCYGPNPKSEQDHEVVLQLLISDLQYVCQKRRNMDHLLFFQKLGLNAPPIETPNPPDKPVKNQGERWQKACEILMIDPKYFIAPTLAYLDSHSRTSGFCMGLTNLNLVGLFPPLTQKDDNICILKGFSLPVVLRKDGDHYIHIGACFIPGLTQGEAGTLLGDGRAFREDVSIR
jgi:hypothetical protein